jgi:hypothetical protein
VVAAALLRCYQRQNRPDQFEGMAQTLLGLWQRETIPEDGQAQLQAVRETRPPESSSEAVRKLRDLTRH